MNLAAHPPRLRRAIVERYGRLDALVVLTDADLAAYGDLFGDRMRVQRIPNAVPAAAGDPAPLAAPTVLAAGRLRRQKGFDRLIRAFARVAGQHPEWRLRICGRGRERQALERLVEEHGLSGVVELTGPVRDLAREMESASLFVLSSRFEGFPMVLLEAMSHGLPVVSFDCPTGPREVVESGVNGLLVPDGDERALGDAIVRMIGDAELRQRCGHGSLATSASYTPDQIGPRWAALVAELTGSPPQRRPAS
jgi:glycosyltransferase involved in cell wall biosynthesis